MRTLPTIVGLKPHGKITTFYNRITCTHLINAALIFLSLLSVLLFIIVLAQANNRGQNNNNNNNNYEEYCLNRGCLSAATQQLNFMNSTASTNRCLDFYNYACGGWQQTHPIQSSDAERTILGDIINQQDTDIERLLNSPISRISTQSWEWKVKTYYTECLDDYARVPNSGKIIVELIQNRDGINGWFLFDNTAANSSQKFLLKNQTIYRQISYIHGELGATIAFDLHVRFDDIYPNIKRLEFSPAGLSMEVDDYLSNDTVSERRRSIYQVYILEILAILAREAEIYDENLSNRIYTIASDIFAIERYLAEYFQHSIDYDDKTTMMTLREMSDQYSFDFIQLMINELGNSSNISETTSVYVTYPRYFRETFFLFSKNNNDPLMARHIHNYMRWRLIHTYIEDLSYNYIHAYRLFLANYYNNALHLSNEEYCTREIRRKFPLAIQRLYTMNLTIHSDIIQTTFNLLKDGFKEYINEQATWMIDETTKRIARQKIDALTAAIGYASIALNDTRLDEYYEKFVCDDKSHIENAYSYHRFHRWTIANSLINPNQYDHWDYFEIHTTDLFDYIPIFNRLFIIANAMHEPLVHSEWPWSINLGSLGVLLAQKLFTSIDGSNGIPDWWSLSTKNAYNTSRQCIANYYINEIKTLSYSVNNHQVKIQLTGEPFSLVTLRHIGALRFVYTIFKKMKSMKIPGTELTNEQTFFLAYAQTQCYQRQELLQYIRTQSGIYDEKIALNAALHHMPEFAKAFQCQLRENTCF